MELQIGDWALREWRADDIPSLVRHANNRNVWINLRDRFPHPYTKADGEAWLALRAKDVAQTQFAIASPGEAIGGIGVELQSDDHRRSAEIGYWLAEPFWNRGIMTLAARAMTEYAFAAFDLVRIYATVADRNPASARVLEKAGYSLEGHLRKSVVKDGKLVDELLYAIVRE